MGESVEYKGDIVLTESGLTFGNGLAFIYTDKTGKDWESSTSDMQTLERK